MTEELIHGHVIKSGKEIYFVVDTGLGNLTIFNFKPLSSLADFEIIGYKNIDLRLSIQDAKDEKDLLRLICF
jgi:calcineurin-like phosphoesterase family protein